MIRKQQMFVSAILWAACRLAVAHVGPVTILEIETQGKVTYFNDVDYSKLSSSPASVIPVGAPNANKPFVEWFDISDIVAVNGRPAKGTWINAGLPSLNLRPDATPGMRQSVGDITRAAMVYHYLETSRWHTDRNDYGERL